jgi:D-alanine-D-alanine ligase
MTLRVAIVCGGRSSEHEISCTSAGGVLGAIDRSKYEPVMIGITKSGRWTLIAEGFDFSIHDGALPVVPEDGEPVSITPAGFFLHGEPLNIDIAFPILHGPYGEDGTIQGLLEIADIPFVGSGVLASAVAMDKSFAKSIFAASGIPVVEGILIRKSEWAKNKSALEADIATLGYPVFVKPVRGGSSRGTTKVSAPQHLSDAIAEAHRFDPKALVENAVIGREIECAVLEIDGLPQASVVGQIEIDSQFEFYDFEAKYLHGATSITLPAPILAKLSEEIQKQAIAAFISLGCSGLARVDFFLTPNGEVIINELNTMPGFTASSAYPKMWAASGVAYQEVISHLLKNALLRNNGALGN